MTLTPKPLFPKILVATDFSEHAKSAVKQAIWLARQSHAQLMLANTLPDLRSAVHSTSAKARVDLLYGEGELFEREIRRDSDEKLRRLITELAASDLAIKFETLLGDPSVEITHAVQQEGYDLVVAGTRGHSAWSQFFVGSTASRLIRMCPASVWIVKAEHAGVPKRILAATDFSHISRKAVLQGWRLADRATAEFHLLHVLDSADAPKALLDKIPDGRSLRSQIDEEAKLRFDAFVQSLGIDPGSIQCHLSYGTPWQEISHLAQICADLIAVGTIGRSGVQGVLLGNTAEKVLTHCDCSILTAKPDNFISPIEPAGWQLHP